MVYTTIMIRENVCQIRRPARRLRFALAGAAAVLLAGALAAPAAGATTTHRPGGVFPPRANSTWAYDTGTPGTWVDDLTQYNRRARPGHALNEVYSYGSDLEMYCPDNDGTQCTKDKLVFDYSDASGGPQRTAAYYQAFDAKKPGSVIISPIIDGRTDSNGYLQGFNELSPALAAYFADKVASQVCADPHVDGIQFDLEPFDVSSRNGQYWFYRQIGKDFAGQHAGRTAADPYGCVDAGHPQGRFYSVFTFASSIAPGTASAGNVAAILNGYGNGYLMDSLYDLSSAPAGTLDGLATYTRAVRREALETELWAARLHVKFGFGIPASASSHEFTTCTADPDALSSCLPDASGRSGYSMIDYTTAAVNAIDLIGAPLNPDFIGTAIWAFTDHVSWNGVHFGPALPPDDVLGYLGKRLPGSLY
jgi:hypothetical protein